MRIATIVGARPQFIKAATLSRVFRQEDRAAPEVLIHTGQHFDTEMSDVFFDQMDLPAPDVNLGIAGGSHGQMTGRMLEAIEAVLLDVRPDWVLVYGDTNSTLAGALAAAKLDLPLAHVEAGLRSFNRAMPEETNRRLADHAATLLFAPTPTAVTNLRREGIEEERIVSSGDVMYDAMLHHRDRAAARSRVHDRLGLTPGRYLLATIHRAETTDDPQRLCGAVTGLSRLAECEEVVLPLHPRTRNALERHGLTEEAKARLHLVPPVGYLDMLMLERDAALIATDSGGVQKEAYFWGVPSVTLREETEWTELLEAGASTLVGTDPDRIEAAGRAALGSTISNRSLFGTGRAAEEIAARLLSG